MIFIEKWKFVRHLNDLFEEDGNFERQHETRECFYLLI